MRRSIIVVEDNPADSRMLKMALARRDSTIATLVIDDGADALKFFSSHADTLPCDLILLDLNLPRVSGFEILEFLKSHPQLKRTPVIVLSGSSTQQDVERCYRTGANCYICKPTGLDAVFTMIDDLIRYWFEQAQLPTVAASVRMN